MNGVYIIIGGNIGDRFLYLSKANSMIETEIGKIILKSNIYQTAAWGNTDQHAFLNQVLYIHTTLNAKMLLETCLQIEKKLGRVRDKKWDARIIDIDILFYKDSVINQPNLKIPHPYLQNRRFVLVPLAEIAPHFIHPILQKSIKNLLSACQDTLEVKRIENTASNIA